MTTRRRYVIRKRRKPTWAGSDYEPGQYVVIDTRTNRIVRITDSKAVAEMRRRDLEAM